ncbi:MAG: pyridoxal-phosphate-dependent aminotransferase family protein [Planctomycetota bacterium]|jgi:aspartate aminotransferase-like enzyme
MTDSFGRFFLPGPSEVHPDVLAAMQKPMIGHRSAACTELIEAVQPCLREVFGTERTVLIGATSATGFMEAGVRLLPAGRVLALVNGAFSERYASIAEACGHAVDRMTVEWGEAHDPAAVTARCEQSDYRAVLVAHNETSTGVVQPIMDLANAIAPTPLLVDSTSGAGGAELRFDDWDLGFALTGSQKALALPPGIAFAVVREDLFAKAPDRGSYYFDLRRYPNKQPPFTPALPQMYALEAQTRRIAAEGFGARLDRHRTMAALTQAWAESKGLHILAQDAARRSPTVTCILRDESTELLRRMSSRGYTLGNGYGRLKNHAFRIGHMGDQTPKTLEALLATLDSALST